MLSIALLIFLALLVVVLMLIEVFLIPGIGLFGVLSVFLFIGVDFWLFAYMSSPWFGLGFIIGCVVLFLLSFYLLSSTKLLDRFALKKTLDKSVPTSVPTVSVGMSGRAVSRLALKGRAEIGGVYIEVTSDSGYIDAGTPVVVRRIDSGTIYVCEA